MSCRSDAVPQIVHDVPLIDAVPRIDDVPQIDAVERRAEPFDSIPWYLLVNSTCNTISYFTFTLCSIYGKSG